MLGPEPSDSMSMVEPFRHPKIWIPSGVTGPHMVKPSKCVTFKCKSGCTCDSGEFIHICNTVIEIL